MLCTYTVVISCIAIGLSSVNSYNAFFTLPFHRPSKDEMRTDQLTTGSPQGPILALNQLQINFFGVAQNTDKKRLQDTIVIVQMKSTHKNNIQYNDIKQ
jgi:hypothetical protein